MAAPPRTDPNMYRVTFHRPAQSTNGNAARRGIQPIESHEATTLALDSYCLLMEAV